MHWKGVSTFYQIDEIHELLYVIGKLSCGTYTQWNITQLLQRMHLSQF